MAKTRQQLEAGGWKVASVTGGAHLKTTLEMHQELGIEVYLEEVKPEEYGSCTECFTEATRPFIESTPNAIPPNANPEATSGISRFPSPGSSINLISKNLSF